jgi:NAD(P)-dependent dehydrogenase (short-subunit alcohol dehydrogenase family)
VPFEGAAGYAAANAAVLASPRSSRSRERPTASAADTLVPKLIDTPANRAAGIQGGADPADVARVICWLCDDASSAVTGADIPV